jgi:hypothetical protein
MSEKPVINFTDEKIKILIDGKEVKSPFIPDNNEPENIAKIIDEFVLSKEFRNDIFRKEFDFVKKISDPNKAGEWWDSLFEKIVNENPSINRKSSKIEVNLRMNDFLISNRLYFKKIKRIIGDTHDT